MIKTIVFSIFLLLISSYATAKSVEGSIAKYMIENFDIIEKQINIQYKMIGNEKYNDKIFKTRDSLGQSPLKVGDYIITQAFNHHKVPIDSILKPVSKIYGKSAFTFPDGRSKNLKFICPIFFSPQIINWLYTVEPISEDEIKILAEAFERYRPLFQALIDQISLHSPHNPNNSSVSNDQSCFPHQRNIDDLLLSQTIIFETYLKGSKYYFHADLSTLDKHISNLSLSHLKHLENIFIFLESSEYFRIIGDLDQAKNKVEKYLSAGLNSNNFDDLFNSNEENTPEENSTSSGLNFDDLDL